MTSLINCFVQRRFCIGKRALESCILVSAMMNDLGSQWLVSECMEFYMKLATAVLVMVATYSFFGSWKNRRLPPGPFALPIIGNLHQLGVLPHQDLAALSLKYGPLMSLSLGSVLTIVVSSPDMAKEFLKTYDRIFASRNATAAAKYLSYNCSDIVMAPYGSQWRQMRKVCVLQLLSSRRIESFRFIRDEELSAMIHSINSHSRGPSPVNIRETVAALTDAIVCRMAFGRKYSEEHINGSRDFNSLRKEIVQIAVSFNVGDYIPYLAWVGHLQGFNRRLKNLAKLQDELLEKIIEQHVVAQNDPNGTPDLVDVLLEVSADKDTAEPQITRENLKGVIADILNAGPHSMSSTIEWMLVEVLANPPVLKKIKDELECVVGSGCMVQESDLPRLVYLDAAVKETLRLHPSGPLCMPHVSVEVCNVLGYEIPKGTQVLLNAWAIGRNLESWEDAESFKPERFMESAGSFDAKVQNFEWIPFGAGRRGCPAQQFGMIVVAISVAQLLHCFDWKLPDDMNGQELDRAEIFDGLALTRARELWAVPTPRLPIMELHF